MGDIMTFNDDIQSSVSAEDWIAVFNQSPVGIAFVGLNGEWLKCNQKLCSMLEYTEYEMSKKKFQDVTHPEDIESDLYMLRKLENGEIPGYEMLKRYITKTNKILWVRLTVWPIKNRENKIVHYISHVQPLLNGEKMKMEKVDNHVEIRPTISMGEFLSDNWKSFIAAGIFIIASFITLGTAFWTTVNKLDILEQSILNQNQELINLYKEKVENHGERTH